MLALSMVMYAVSATDLALNISYIKALEAGLLTKVLTIFFVLKYLPSVNFMLSDGILLWRAWVLWNRRFLLFITPLIFLVCTFGTTIASAINFFNIFQFEGKSGYTMNKGQASTTTILIWSAIFFTIGTNIWATGLIFIRAWQHRRVLRSLGVKGTFKSNTEKTLAFLVESGALYLCIWIAYLSTSVVTATPGMDFFGAVTVQLAGMYPTMIVVVVAMQLSTADILSHPGVEADSPFVFPPLSPGPQVLAPNLSEE
ncbi:hypothetical protein BC827DRAFT_1372328 [Russula dissimulans]|nr:hypothetical protein BC827DRAFT_1372328 [Russula dissimulans]